MNILASFIPWIVFFIFSILGIHAMTWGAGAAILAHILIMIRQSSRTKFLDYCSMGFFIALIILSGSHYSLWIEHHIGYISHGYLALVVLYSILIKAPFTLAYAKETTSREKWGTPIFYNINLLISIVWLLFFILNLGAQMLCNVAFAWYIILQIFLVIVAIQLTKRIPTWVLKREKIL